MYHKITLYFSLLALLIWNPMLVAGQHQATAELKTETTTYNNLQDFLRKGIYHGHLRNYFMATWNKGDLSDHYANALGAKFGYHSANFHGLHFGFAGQFTFNTISSDLEEKDKISGKLPRYELELFDLQDAGNRSDLDRLDELYLEYRTKKIKVTAGRFSFTSPLINPQDGRMKPYAVQGASTEIYIHKYAMLTGAWLNHFSPRSTVSWFNTPETIGIYSVGVDETGSTSGYKNNVNSKGVAIAGLQLSAPKQLKADVWNYWIENISNTTYARAVVAVKPDIKIGVEGLYQVRAGNGGNVVPALAYFPDQEMWVSGAMVAYEPLNWHFSINYLHLGDGGRFLFPKEFGREQFFATMSRGRLEGLGKADALTLKVRRNWQKTLSAELGITKTWLPGANNYRYNKYGSESYWNGLLDVHYHPEAEIMKGLSFRFLYVGRISPGSVLPLERMFYKTNFHHLNFVTQISF